MSMKGQISVITTSYNDERNVRRFVENINSQTFKPDELLIIDGGSNDNTLEVVEELTHCVEYSIRFVSRGRLNIAQAFNIGIKEANNQYVIICCMGNHFSDTAFENLYNSVVESNSDASYGLLCGVDRGSFSRIYNRAYLGSSGLDIMSNRLVLYNKNVFNQIGYFIENFHYAGEDAEFLKRFNDFKLKKTFINKKIVFWETPNSLKDFIKQTRNYTIAELQYASMVDCFFSGTVIKWTAVLTLFLFGMKYPLLWIIDISLLFIIILKNSFGCKSILGALLREYGSLLKFYYLITKYSYFLPSNRVNQIRFS